jgi:Tol biopolymer transport system component
MSGRANRLRPPHGLRGGCLALFIVGFCASALSAPVTECVSTAAFPHPLESNDASWVPAVSADGRYVAFVSLASNLVAGDTNGDFDVFVRDRQGDSTTLVSVSAAGGPADGSSFMPAISANGRYVAFASSAGNLIPADGNAHQDIFVRDRVAGVTERVSVGVGGAPPNGYSSYPSISADGRYVAYESEASNLVSGDANGVSDVFVYDRVTGQTRRVSVSSNGSGGNGASWLGAISADGGFVAFLSDATNLVDNDTNGRTDVYVHNLQSGSTRRVSVGWDGSEPDANCDWPSISADGSRIAFESAATNLVFGDNNDAIDVFVRDMRTRETLRVSVATGGAEAHGHSTSASISADGSVVGFRSEASDLVPGDKKGLPDIFAHVIATNETTRVSVGLGGVDAGDYSETPSVSADGVIVAFASRAANLVADDKNGEWDVFVYDGRARLTSRVSLGPLCRQANEASNNPAVSADGRFVAFSSFAHNLVSDDNPGTEDVFLRDTASGATTRISLGRQGVPPNGPCTTPAISADGIKIAFVSYASNLADDDTNGFADVYLYDTVTSRMDRVSLTDEGGEANGSNYQPSVSADGRYVAFSSSATNLVRDDTNGRDDVFVRDRQNGRTWRVSVSSSGAQGNGNSGAPAISADGEWIAFVSQADNLVDKDRNGRSDVFLHSTVTGETRMVSIASDGAQANDQCGYPALAADGRFVAFVSGATNLVPHDTNGVADVFVHEVKSGETARVSVSSSGLQASGSSSYPSISGDGRYVAFACSAANLVPGDTNQQADVFVHDRWTGVTRRASVSTQGAEADGNSGLVALSADGRYVAFVSAASNLAAEASMTYQNIYRRGVLSDAVPYTLAEAAAALAVAGGLSLPADVERLDVDQPAANRITLGDALAIARKVAGLSTNP